MKYFSIIALALAFINTGCQGSDFSNAASDVATLATGGPQKITMYDQTHGMAMGTFSLPSDWQFHHEIASKTNEAGFHKYFKEAKGPNGEIMSNLPISMYAAMMGTNFEGSVDQAISQTLSRYVRNPRFGKLTQSHETMTSKGFQKVRERAPGIQALELPFEAQQNGQTVQGVVYVLRMDQGQFGVFFGDILMASPADFLQAKKVYFSTGDSYEENPQYVKLQEQVQARIAQNQRQMAQARSQQSARAHQQRMAMRQQSFNAHQSRMQANSQMMDQSHNRFMNNLNAPSSYNSGGGYSSHNAYIDAVHERQTFNDPYSGQEVHKDGVYDYNYTNGLGDYYRTNDPSFNQNSLQGNWQAIDPNSPN